MTNKELCNNFPFLVPRDIDGCIEENFDYTYTALDSIPTGWRKAFGEAWASDVQEVINTVSPELRESIYPIQLKEKFGEFRQYFSWEPEALEKVIMKYEQLSRKTCISCGASAKWISTGWISPYCDNCKEDHAGYRPIREDE